MNLAGFFYVSQRAVRQMLTQGGGHIVNMTTTLVGQPVKGVPSALASLTKGGLDAVTRSLAIEYADKGIRVNAVAPGVIKTPMHAPETHRLPRRAASAGANGRDPGDRRRGAVPGVGHIRDRRDPARRRRRARRPLVTPREETTMPIVTIQITREGTTPEQKAALIKGATDLLADVLNKPPASDVRGDPGSGDGGLGRGGLPVQEYRRQA